MIEKSKLKTIFEANVTDRLFGSNEVPKEIQDYRLEKCNACKHKVVGKIVTVCGLCSCPLTSKASKSNSVCALLPYRNEEPRWNSMSILTSAKYLDLHNGNPMDVNVMLSKDGTEFVVKVPETIEPFKYFFLLKGEHFIVDILEPPNIKLAWEHISPQESMFNLVYAPTIGDSRIFIKYKLKGEIKGCIVNIRTTY